jgi:hypothetical protein
MSTPIQVVIDAADPHALARFWAAALGYEVEDHTAIVDALVADGRLPAEAVIEVDGGRGFREVAAVRDPDGRGPRVLLQAVPEPKTVKNRVHLDLHVGTERIDAEVERLAALGARRLYEFADRGPRWVTCADPEGNEFCVS